MRLPALCILAATAAFPALANDNPIQGNWKGRFEGGGWENRTLTAQIIATSKVNYRVNLFVADLKLGLEGQRADEKAAAAEFSGQVSVDEIPYTVTATAENEALSGSFTANGTTIPFKMNRIRITPPTLGATPPEGAVVFFDGTNAEANWERSPMLWRVTDDGAMEVSASNLVTKQTHGSGQLHVEFLCPLMAEARDQARANSGVYVQGRYEVQVLDSFGDAPADNLCGGIYKIATPQMEASLPPGEWQTYDITFTAPKFDEAGQKVQNARITVVHNGNVIHDGIELPECTAGGVSDQEAPEGVLMLQDHGNRVRYRNIWFLPAQD
ncbi:MAG TPA: DUF1080 domain-containing protein [Candidatus Hydrogenedentes bacterium]|nr:DUF1080 domain-containing protein [Candidatus Hydrogenedentota bacterium]